MQAAVLPALQSAVAALDSLNKADIIEMRTLIKPPALVQLTMEGVCILLQVRAHRLGFFLFFTSYPILLLAPECGKV